MPQLRKKNRGSVTPPPQGVKLRKISPVVPSKDPEKMELLADLALMGCAGFAEKPWGFREERMVREILVKVSNQFDKTIRGVPHKWTEELWRGVYGFRPGGATMASRKDDYVHGRFQGTVNPKDGYAVEDCIDERHRRLLQFLVPILHPEKPTRMTISLGNTIFGALTGDRKVDWGRFMSELVSSLVTRIQKSRATPLSPYVFHLYKQQQLLTNTEETEWKKQESLLKYGESDSDEEMEQESGSEPEEEEEDDDLPLPPFKRQKTTPPHGRGTPPVPSTSRVRLTSEDPFETLVDILCDVRADWQLKKGVLEEIGALVGAKPDSLLAGRVAECISSPDEIRKLEQENRKIQEELDSSKSELFILKENAAATADMAEEARKLTEQVRMAFGEPGTAVARAKLFDEEVHKDGKISGSRIVRILTDFSEQVERVLEQARTAAERMEESSRRLTEIPIRLSELSLPSILDLGISKEGKDRTPQSKRAARDSSVGNAGIQAINLDSPTTEEAPPVGLEGERNRNLSDVFEELGEKGSSPTIGSKVLGTGQ